MLLVKESPLSVSMRMASGFSWNSSSPHRPSTTPRGTSDSGWFQVWLASRAPPWRVVNMHLTAHSMWPKSKACPSNPGRATTMKSCHTLPLLRLVKTCRRRRVYASLDRTPTCVNSNHRIRWNKIPTNRTTSNQKDGVPDAKCM